MPRKYCDVSANISIVDCIRLFTGTADKNSWGMTGIPPLHWLIQLHYVFVS